MQVRVGVVVMALVAAVPVLAGPAASANEITPEPPQPAASTASAESFDRAATDEGPIGVPIASESTTEVEPPTVTGDPVTDVEVVGGIGTAEVTWVAPAAEEPPIGYEVVGGTATCTTSTAACTLTGLPTNGSGIAVKVRAVYEDGVSDWATTEVTGTQLSLKLSANYVPYGKSTTVSGTVRDGGGAPLAATSVRLERTPIGGTSFGVFATVATSATGAYLNTFPARHIQDVRASVAGGAGRLGALAKVRLVVRAHVTLVAADRWINLADQARFAGSVWPLRPGATANLQRWTGSQWTHVQTLKLDKYSKFRAVRTLMVGKTTQWRVSVAGNPQVVSGVSPTLKVVVAVVPNPKITTVSRSQVPYSWRPGCPIHYSRLRAVTINHVDFSGQFRRGTIVVEQRYAKQVATAFGNGFKQRFPIRSMIPIDAYYAGGTRTGVQADIASMAADNTSGFNCRGVVGHPKRMSAHSVGNAIDVNPRENPYVTGGTVYPKGSSTYLNRSNPRPGMLYSSNGIIKTLRGYGWIWGARIRDFHHISRYGG